MDQFEQIYKYLNIIYKRRYLFLAVSFLSISIFIAASYQIPKKYRTQCTFFVEKNIISQLIDKIAVAPDMQESIRIIKYTLLSRSLIERALNRVKSFDMPQEPAKINAAVKSLTKRTNITVRKNELFFVSFTDTNPVFAQEYLNELVKLYVEENLGDKRNEAYGANRFLDEQLVHFKRELDEAETAIIEFRKRQGVFSSDDEAAILADIRANQREVEDIELMLETQRSRKKQMLMQLKKIPENVSVFTEQEHVDRIVLLENQIRQLLTTYNENYPEIIRLKAELESLKQAEADGNKTAEKEVFSSPGTSMPNPVYQEVQQNIFDLESEISSLEGRKRHLEKIIHKKEINLKENPEYKKELAVLIQERDSSRRIYEQLLTSAGQSEVSKQMELGDKATTFRIVDPAILPRTPVSPNMVRMLLMSIGGGFLIGGGLVIVLNILRGAVNSVNDIKSAGYIILGTIPSIAEPVTVAKRRRTDIFVYCVSFVYFGLVVSVLAYEALLR